jgi:hypothetical protein
MGDEENTPKTSPKVETLDKSDAERQDSPHADSPVDGTIMKCQSEEPLKKSYIHLAIDLILDQYFVNGREQGLKLSALINDWANNADQFHKSQDDSFPTRLPVEKPPERLSPYNLYYIGDAVKGPLTFRAQMTTSCPLIKDHGLEGYGFDKSYVSYFNNYLGQGMALHVTRTKTFNNLVSGDFRWKNVRRIGSHAATEKMGMKIYVYVRMNLDGKPGIYEVKNGIIIPLPKSQEFYDKRKLIKDDQFTDNECESMPLIPGVHQVSILIEESGSSFSLKEVYCDGDCIYPE